MSISHDRIALDAGLVRRLVAAQFPQWGQLPIAKVEPGGWDNLTFRLGDEMLVRLPSAPRYQAQVEKEQQWLPRLAEAGLPVRVPQPLASGNPAPDIGYPFVWSVYQWIEGACASPDNIHDLTLFARDLGDFFRAIHNVETSGAPVAGKHNFHRGGQLRVYDDETCAAIDALHGKIDAESASAIWNAALASRWDQPPVWVHGDIAPDNLLVRNGRLHAVIDFGCCAIGDPACDLVIAWAFFDPTSRAAFRMTLGLDEATWQRARGWALWKSLITLAGHIETSAAARSRARHVLTALLSESML